jgi:nucleotide-binding universal stress UspA family protein
MFPPQSIVAAVDFSEPSREALALAARFARHCGARLHVVHVEDPLLTAAAAREGIDLGGETREELQRFVDTTPPAAACTPCWDVITGPPASGILQVAERERADLIVVGTHGMSGPGRLLFGSVTEGVLRHANRSILVAPDHWVAPRPETDDLSGSGPVVVGIDFCASSAAVARVACALAERLQTSVEALHVVAEPSLLDRWRARAAPALADTVTIARRDLAVLMNGLGATAEITTTVDTGNVAERLTEAATPIGGRHPFIVVGRRNSRTRDGAPGAVAYRVATLAGAPVLMHYEG